MAGRRPSPKGAGSRGGFRRFRVEYDANSIARRPEIAETHPRIASRAAYDTFSTGVYLRNRKRDKPFFMTCSLVQPHDICNWLSLNTQRHETLRYPQLKGQLPPLPANFKAGQNEPPPLVKLRSKQQPSEGQWNELTWRYYFWNYYRHVETVDHEIGRVLRALDETGQTDNTLIVLSADHGEGMGEHQMVRKGYLYDSALKVPLIFSMPAAFKGGRTDPALVSGIDVAPTVCNFAGIPGAAPMTGVSLRPLLEKPGTAPSRPTGDFVVSELGNSQKDMKDTARAIRSRRYKYIKYLGHTEEQLFDVEKDPGETQNLVPGGAHAGVIEEHRAMLRKWEKRLALAPRVTKAGGKAWQRI